VLCGIRVVIWFLVLLRVSRQVEMMGRRQTEAGRMKVSLRLRRMLRQSVSRQVEMTGRRQTEAGRTTVSLRLRRVLRQSVSRQGQTMVLRRRTRDVMLCHGLRQNASRMVARTQITIVPHANRIRTAPMRTIAGLDVIRIGMLGRDERRKSADRLHRREKVRATIARLPRTLRQCGTIIQTRHRNGVLWTPTPGRRVLPNQRCTK